MTEFRSPAASHAIDGATNRALSMPLMRHSIISAAGSQILSTRKPLKRSQTEAEYRRTLFGELNDAERKAAEYAADLAKSEQRTKLQLLTAPVAGMVQQLAVHTVGGVVTPAQTLLV